MKNARLVAAACAAALAALSTLASADDRGRFPRNASFTTLAITPFAIEGLTGDAAGNLYTTGRQLDGTKNCPIWRFNTAGSRVTVAFIPNRPNSAAGAPVSTPCNPSGITFDAFGNLYVADAASVSGVNGVVWRVTPHPIGCLSDDSADPLCASIPTAVAFASNVPGTNGVAFDRHGNLWTGDATTGVGRVWKISPAGGDCGPAFVGCVEAFRIQAMANVLNPLVSGGVANVGRDARTLPPGTINAARAATNTLGSQPLVANGLAFTPDGDLYVADTARGAIWKIEFDRHGDLKTRTGCDTTFTANTLCLDAVLVAHPYLEGTDGIALDRAGNIWNSANERNAIVVVTKDERVLEVFRNPVNPATSLRNAAETPAGNRRIVEFPTSPFLSGKRFCTANSDGDRRDNSPRAAGEINAGNAAAVARGKISCMDQELEIPGLRLPVH